LFQLRVDGTIDPARRPELNRELLRDRDVCKVHLRAVSRQIRVASTDGLEAPLEFHAEGDPATNDGYRVSPDGLRWERIDGSDQPRRS